ncbi:unnamed protein product [Rotaria magnacalcarata]|uniref:Uncharacterized protein n=4 Tax=Rotaria magnacalcarata TaxID=392030 RepID=A0A8S2T0Y5_9BILA|nr:unnamed protein product [Rotaria magnacalcarata]
MEWHDPEESGCDLQLMTSCRDSPPLRTLSKDSCLGQIIGSLPLFSCHTKMLPILDIPRDHSPFFKRQLLKVNIGGHEKNTNHYINGNDNNLNFDSEESQEEQLTLLRKAGQQAGRILEGGTDVAMAPVKWLAHMQDNWLTYIVCATILMVGFLFIYCCIRRKISSLVSPTSTGPNVSKMIMDEAAKLAAYQRAIQNI